MSTSSRALNIANALLRATIAADALEKLASDLRGGIPCQVPSLAKDISSHRQFSMTGGFNVLLEVQFDDGVVWLARVPRVTNVAPPPAIKDYFILNEVATLHFLRNIGIPVPKVHAYDNGAASIGIPFVLMDRLDGVVANNVFPSPQGKKFLEQLANIFISLEAHPFTHAGSLASPGTNSVSGYATEIMFTCTPGKPPHPLGPFVDGSESLRETLHVYISLVSRREFAPYHSVDAYLVYRWLLDIIPRLPAAGLDLSGPFYLKHDDDVGFHMLVDEKSNITGIIDWETSYTAPKGIAFASPLMLVPQEWHDGENTLSEHELAIVDIFKARGRDDMAGFISRGRVAQRIRQLLDRGCTDTSDKFAPHVKGLEALLDGGDIEFDWEAWKKKMLYRYREETTLKDLLHAL